MSDEGPRMITFVAGPETENSNHRHWAGMTMPIFGPHVYVVPAVGWEGTLWGCPGVMRDGDRWEIKPVDMRSPREKKLDEIADILRGVSRAAEPSEVQVRHLMAQQLILEVQLDDLRRHGG